MDEDILGYDEVVEGEEDILGAVRRAIRARPGSARSMMRALPRPPLAASVPTPSKIRSFLGFGSLSWTGAADSADKTSIIEPQESFRGERLVIAQVVTGGTDAGLTSLKRIEVGTQPQQPSTEQGAPVAMFSSDAVGSELDLQVCRQGVKLAVTLGRTASPGAGVTTTALIGMYGEWIR